MDVDDLQAEPEEAPPGIEERRGRLWRFLVEEEIWPMFPPEVRGTTITKAEREGILGYGPDGF